MVVVNHYSSFESIALLENLLQFCVPMLWLENFYNNVPIVYRCFQHPSNLETAQAQPFRDLSLLKPQTIELVTYLQTKTSVISATAHLSVPAHFCPNCCKILPSSSNSFPQ